MKEQYTGCQKITEANLKVKFWNRICLLTLAITSFDNKVIQINQNKLPKGPF